MQGFFTVLFRTMEGFMLLCQDSKICRELATAMSDSPAPPPGELPLLPRTHPTTAAPEGTLATQLAFLATAKDAWDTATAAASGSQAAMHSMHALLHLAEDDEMCHVRLSCFHCSRGIRMCHSVWRSTKCCACSHCQ
jgi:hypothetical protein